jgi:hypothetical protein
MPPEYHRNGSSKDCPPSYSRITSVSLLSGEIPPGSMARAGITTACALMTPTCPSCRAPVVHQNACRVNWRCSLRSVAGRLATPLGGRLFAAVGARTGSGESVRSAGYDLRKGCRSVPLEKTERLWAPLGENANLIGRAASWHHGLASPVPRSRSNGAAFHCPSTPRAAGRHRQKEVAEASETAGRANNVPTDQEGSGRKLTD